MPTFKELWNFAIEDFFTSTAIYVIVVVPFFLVFWVTFKNYFSKRRIQVKKRSNPQLIRKEIFYSFTTLVIFTVIDVIIYLAQKNGYTRLYENVEEYGWVYLIFSTLYVILLHDAWFYWAHRFMHHPKVYKLVHKIHHESTDPSPFTAFSFHPLEAVIESTAFITFAFIFPLHLFALLSWQMIQMILNVIAHLGYEIFPKGFNTHWLYRWKAPSTHHNMHHERFNGNYGFYFTWWDKWMGTEMKNYNETFNKVHERIAR